MDSVESVKAAMENEVKVISERITEIQSQRQELEKALKLTEAELYRLDGRLSEAKAVVAFLGEKLAPKEEVEEEEDASLEN